MAETTFAVPTVAGSVSGPELVVDGEDGSPPDLMVGAGVCGGGGDPFEALVDVGVLFVALPVGFVVGTADGGVVFGAEPGSVLVVEVGLDVGCPVAEGASVALVVGYLAGYFLCLGVDFED